MRSIPAQSVFWCQVLGYHEDPDDPNLPGHEENEFCILRSRAEVDAARSALSTEP